MAFKHPEERKAYQRSWAAAKRAENPEAAREAARKYRAKNLEIVREADRAAARLALQGLHQLRGAGPGVEVRASRCWREGFRTAARPFFGEVMTAHDPVRGTSDLCLT